MRFIHKMMLGAGLALSFAMPAHATIYDYTLSGTPNNLVIDTTAGTGSLTSNNGAIDISFTGNFASFMGGINPVSMFNIVINPASHIISGGHTYTLVNPATTHPDMLDFQGSSIKLWAEWSSAGCSTCGILGDINSNITGGGTPVPEPGMLGLMGLGVAGLMWQRRRSKAALAV